MTSWLSWLGARAPLLLTLTLIALISIPYLLGGTGLILLFALLAFIAWRVEGAPKLSRAELCYSLIGLVYFLYFTIGLALTSSPDQIYRFGGESLALAIIGLLLIGLSKCDLERLTKYAGDLLLPAMVLLTLWALFERYSHGAARVKLATTSPLILGPLIAGGVHISLGGWKSRGWLWRIGAIIAWCLGFYVLAALNGSRSALLGYFVAGAIFAGYVVIDVQASWRSHLTRLVPLYIAGLTACWALLYFVAHTDSALRYSRVAEFIISGAEGELGYSSMTRILYYQLGWDAFWEAPIFGIGIASPFDAIKADWPYDTEHGHLHSDQLNHAIGGGVIGWALLNAAIFFPLALMFRRRPDHRAIYLTIVITMIIFVIGLFTRMFFRPNVVSWSVLALCFALSLIERGHKEDRQSR